MVERPHSIISSNQWAVVSVCSAPRQFYFGTDKKRIDRFHPGYC